MKQLFQTTLFVLFSMAAIGQDTTQVTVDSVGVDIDQINDSTFQVIETTVFNDGGEYTRKYPPQGKNVVKTFYRESVKLLDRQKENIQNQIAELRQRLKDIKAQRKKYRQEYNRIKDALDVDIDPDSN